MKIENKLIISVVLNILLLFSFIILSSIGPDVNDRYGRFDMIIKLQKFQFKDFQIDENMTWAEIREEYQESDYGVTARAYGMGLVCDDDYTELIPFLSKFGDIYND